MFNTTTSGDSMESADVTFSRTGEAVEMTLLIDGIAVANSRSQESIARELQIRAVRFLTIEDLFSTELPTSEKTLSLATDVGFSEQMAAMKLIAACSSMGEVPTFSFRERRAVPRAEGYLRAEVGD
nr:hypothetical protein [uncultured Duganella sp.]